MRFFTRKNEEQNQGDHMSAKKILYGLAILVSLLFISCASQPQLRFTVYEPAEIDMSSYRNIAVPSTKKYSGFVYPSMQYIPFSYGTWNDYRFHLYPYNGYSVPLSESVATYANEKLVSSLQNTNYFHSIVTGPLADAAYYTVGYTASKDNPYSNIDAFITSEITDMTCYEYLDPHPVYKYVRYTDKDGKEKSRRVLDYYDFTLYQTVSIAVTYRVMDAKTGAIIGSRTIKDKRTNSTYISRYTLYAPSFYPYYQGMLDGISASVLKSLAPHKRVKVETLMANDPSLKEAEDAWKMVEDGNVVLASEKFKSAWENMNHVPSGYNLAIVYYSLGKYDESITLLKTLYETTGNKDIGQKLIEVQASARSEERAKRQL